MEHTLINQTIGLEQSYQSRSKTFTDLFSTHLLKLNHVLEVLILKLCIIFSKIFLLKSAKLHIPNDHILSKFSLVMVFYFHSPFLTQGHVRTSFPYVTAGSVNIWKSYNLYNHAQM